MQFRLTKKNHALKTAYGTLQEELGNNLPTPKNIAEAVIAIRQRKLPDPKKIGNSGSFFKNPVITEKHFQKLLVAYPEMPHYRISNSEVKIPWGFSKGTNVVQTERDAKRLFPRECWNDLHLQIIWYGREYSPRKGSIGWAII